MVTEDPIKIEIEELDDFDVRPPSALSKMWSSSSSEIGVVGMRMVEIPSTWGYHNGYQVFYEVFVSFPDLHKEWTVRRTYPEFLDLHRLLLTSFHKKMLQRHILLPKPSRFEFGLSTESRYAQSAARLQDRLNSYLHRLLEIHDISSSLVFQRFFDLRESDLPTKPSSSSSSSTTGDPSSGTTTASSDSKASPLSPSSTESISSVDTTSMSSSHPPTSETSASSSSPYLMRRGSDWQLAHSLQLTDNLSSINHTDQDVVTLQTMHQSRTPAHVLPPESAVVKVTSNCSSLVLYGSTVSLRTCAGLRVGLTKRSAWSGSQKMAAVAAGGATMVLLSGPVGLTLAAIGSLGKHQLSKTYSLTVQPKEAVKYDQFLIESASKLSGAGRAVHYGDTVRLLNVSRHQYLKVASPVDSKRGYVSVTASASSATLFRWLSPLGYRGPIVCGSPACLQLAPSSETQWQDELLSVHKDYITTDGSPAVFHLVLHNHPCLANEDMSRTVARPLPKPVVVRCMVYNVWFLPPVASSLLNLSPFKPQRAHALPTVLPAHVDIIVFCEAFDAGAKIVLTTEMKRRGYLYETRNAGSKSHLKAFNSGLFAMSKYPLEQYDELLFGSHAVGDDKVADKGAIYVQMRKGGEVIHVVGTHMQAWESEAAVSCREKQLDMIARWVEAKKIPKRDAVLFAGDFNIDKCATPSNKEYEWMLSALKAKNPATIAGTPDHSFDPFTNILASKGKSSGGKLERLDYVMFGTEYRQPHTSWTEVLPLKVDEGHGWEDKALYDTAVRDLSDHYPVLSEFHFG
ncbi:Aste57867_22808 [Aphanomyces stellatus]|uniref:sphingomyelin phosphodiesterase n=1 Tax=Aphanomyces stellatus TaxID=120398 RepID=A0A485LLS1_9STRA|nr:hypothetical protein As57867_022738 [Aphanomyces stellatus]VFT99459.1 Aste57867_22808 [Aphanomyces stellatus]